tara:strand:+ start:23575 stop:24030 length:456 start_codon:yes stop_codon:yes gene_type:complete
VRPLDHYHNRQHALDAEKRIEVILGRYFAQLEHVGHHTQAHPDHDYIGYEHGKKVLLEVKCTRLFHTRRGGTARARGSWTLQPDNCEILAGKEGFYIFVVLLKDEPVIVVRCPAEECRFKQNISIFDAEGMELLFPTDEDITRGGILNENE